ncbi:CRISPR-associated helicase/endonuclease Cas3 [Oceanisphaera marina]|uniref:CRISPR-associated helicase/endonuclease Cas3 n=1 Tax=Oceanisphaera marina TaxID=2017550 RepID=A0ABQ1IWD3_9GAMM|nr:CRISPR-associated helicase Cas3' [Oceanisphaera marina]GGB54121.1 CRISPR-associated helicase/endonuclease Cas3 [Oceanisphaera marina]
MNSTYVIRDCLKGWLEGGARVDHSTWGAKKAIELYPQIGLLLAYTIAGHHAGLANGKAQEKQKLTSLESRLLADLPQLHEIWQQELSLVDQLKLPAGFIAKKDRGLFQLSLLTRMIFSCLVDADFIDTDNFYRKVENKPLRDIYTYPSLVELNNRLDKLLNSFKADTQVKQLRRDILQHVQAQAEQSPGLFSLTVPTGGGKSLTSLSFALQHAIKHGMKRVIYVIPFTSIVEQNAAVFRGAFGELGEDAVLEHHSAFEDDESKALESKEKRQLAMQNWDAPIIVTTSVQFFESLFANRPSRCRKLHNIANSVVILDEVQTLPLNLLRPCVTLLDELALNYKTSLVLCTATQPALNKEQGFFDGFENVRELAPNPIELYEKLRRVNVRHIGALTDEELAAEFEGNDQLLCIVNNRRHARSLYQAIAHLPGTFHLTTLMYAKHRSEVLAEIRQTLKSGKPCRVVSTSLIEAGVDVDFPLVLRAEAGLDSIAQAAGRCNREGIRDIKKSETRVFATENEDWAPPPELKQFAQVFRSVARKHGEDLLSLEAVEDYFKQLYWQKGEQELDAKNLLGLLKSSCPVSLPFEKIAQEFKFIESNMLPVIVPFIPGTNRVQPEIEAALKDLEYAPSAAKKLQTYLVQIPERAFKELKKNGALYAVGKERFGEQFMRLENPDLYSADYGLHWGNPVFIQAQSSVI